MRRTATGVIWIAALALLATALVPLGRAEQAPIRTTELRAALDAVAWENADSGIEFIRTGASGTGILALRIDPAFYRFDLLSQDRKDGERVAELGQRAGAKIAVNGGFFGEKGEGEELFPVGMLRIGGKVFSQAWARTGGFIAFYPKRTEIIPTYRGMPASDVNLVQSKPVLIEPGQTWAMNTNQGNLRRRTLLCLQPDGRPVLVLVTGFGMSLFEAGWLLRERAVGGYFGCDSAIALDGGGSTQLWFDARPEFEIRGETPVHNAIVVIPSSPDDIAGE